MREIERERIEREDTEIDREDIYIYRERDRTHLKSQRERGQKSGFR